MAQHKWHKEIKAWADGAEIEYRETIGDAKWVYLENPAWLEDDIEYRIKPQPKEPQYLYVYLGNRGYGYQHFVSTAHPTGMKEYYYLGKIKLESDDDTSGT